MRSLRGAIGAAALAVTGCDQLWALQHVPKTDAGASDGREDGAAPSACGAITIADDYNDNVINPAVWYAWADTGASTMETNQELRLSLGSGAVEDKRQAETVSLSAFDLRGHAVSVELTLISNATMKLQAVLFARDEATNDGFAFVAEQGRLYFGRRVQGNYSSGPSMAYNAADHRFFQLREVGGRVYYAVSFDGMNWHDLAEAPVQISLTSMKIGVYVYMDGNGLDPGYATFDNFRFCDLTD